MLTKDHKTIVHPADPFPALRRSMRQAVKGRKEVVAMQQKTPQLQGHVYSPTSLICAAKPSSRPSHAETAEPIYKDCS